MIFLVTNGGYMFFYETHMHTSEGSACGFASGAMQARHYKALGYDGIVVTDHFFNGNSRINVDFPFESWERKIDLFCKGYENAYDEGKKIGLKVFFGFEFFNVLIDTRDFCVDHSNAFFSCATNAFRFRRGQNAHLSFDVVGLVYNERIAQYDKKHKNLFLIFSLL